MAIWPTLTNCAVSTFIVCSPWWTRFVILCYFHASEPTTIIVSIAWVLEAWLVPAILNLFLCWMRLVGSVCTALMDKACIVNPAVDAFVKWNWTIRQLLYTRWPLTKSVFLYLFIFGLLRILRLVDRYNRVFLTEMDNERMWRSGDVERPKCWLKWNEAKKDTIYPFYFHLHPYYALGEHVLLRRDGQAADASDFGSWWDQGLINFQHKTDQLNGGMKSFSLTP